MKKISKVKHYKHFSFPNKLPPVGLLYYYLRELKVIPLELRPEKILKIVNTLIQDYLEGHLTKTVFADIIDIVFYSFGHKQLEKKIEKETPGLYQLITHCTELDKDSPHSLEVTKKLLKIYLKNPKEYSEIFQEGKTYKMYTS